MTGNPNHVYSKIQISLSQAMAGASITLKSPAGKKLRIKLREGIQNGQVLRLEGEGGQHADADLYLKVNIMDHPIFKTDGLNLHSLLRLPPAQALYGGGIHIEGPAGEEVFVRVPEDSQNGDQIVVTGKGFSDGKHRGDLVLRVEITPSEDTHQASAEFLKHQLRSEWLN